MISIQSYIDEGFEVQVLKESDGKPELPFDHDDCSYAICVCPVCNDEKNTIRIDPRFVFYDHNPKVFIPVHDRCYVSALAQWGLKEEV